MGGGVGTPDPRSFERGDAGPGFTPGQKYDELMDKARHNLGLIPETVETTEAKREWILTERDVAALDGDLEGEATLTAMLGVLDSDSLIAGPGTSLDETLRSLRADPEVTDEYGRIEDE